MIHFIRRISKVIPHILLLFLLVGHTQVRAGDDIDRPEGTLQASIADDIWPQTMKGSVYNEFWTYHFYLDHDIEIIMVYSLANFGSLKSAVSGARASIIGFDDNTYQVLREYSLDHLVMDKENWKLRLHPERDIWFEGKLPDRHVVHFRTRKAGISYDIQLELSEIQEGLKWGDGMFRVNGRSLGIVTHIPYAEVSGTVSINDETKEVTGTAYMDHTYQNQVTTRMLSRGYRTIYHNNAQDWQIGYYLLADSRSQTDVVGYHIGRNSGGVSLEKPVRIERNDYHRVDGHYLPNFINVEFESGAKNNITRKSNHETFGLLQEVSGLARRIARSYLRGEVFEFRGKAELESEASPKPINYNFFIVN